MYNMFECHERLHLLRFKFEVSFFGIVVFFVTLRKLFVVYE